MLKRSFIGFLVLWLNLSSSWAETLPHAMNFQDDGKALNERQIILVLVSQNGCSYCEQITEQFLNPMYSGGLYQQKVLFRELNMDQSDSITDFDGLAISPRQFARRYQASLTPTLLFLGPSGQRLVSNLIGINTIEFYGYYLDQAIDQAIALR